MEKVLDKKNLEIFFKDLQETYKIIGPTLKGGGTAQYSYPTLAPVEKLEDLILNYGVSMVSLKNIFFPDNQKLFRFEKSGDDVIISAHENGWAEKRLFFGIHPCDISALLCLDNALMDGLFEDSRYKSKRENSVLIGMTCASPGEFCFCNSSGAGPDIETGYDLLMTDIGNKYYVRSGSMVGYELLSAPYFQEATSDDTRQRAAQLEKVSHELPKPLSISQISKNILERNLDKCLKEYTDLCFTCGACNMVCPTCHCFTIVEKTNPEKNKGTRNLIWDSCHYEKFATMAGDVKIRPDVKSRFTHRVLDKFYYDANRYGRIFCVGCGRCREFCPGHMSIRDAAKKIQEV